MPNGPEHKLGPQQQQNMSQKLIAAGSRLTSAAKIKQMLKSS